MCADDIAAVRDHVGDERGAQRIEISQRRAPTPHPPLPTPHTNHLPHPHPQHRVSPLLAEETGEPPGGRGDDQLVTEVFEIVGGGSEIVTSEVGIAEAFRQPALGAQAIGSGDRLAQLIEIAALSILDNGRIEHRRLAPGLPAGRRVDRARDDGVIELRTELLAQIPGGKTGQQSMFGVLRRREREHGEARDLRPCLLSRVRGAELRDRRRNRGEVAFDEWVVEMHSGREQRRSLQIICVSSAGLSAVSSAVSSLAPESSSSAGS